MQLSTIEKDTIGILKYALSEYSNIIPMPSIPWTEIQKELSAQAVAYIPAHVVPNLNISEKEKYKYSVAFGKNFRQFNKVLYEQKSISTLLSEIPYVTLKGAAAAMYYPKPELRQMGDIDILVMPEHYERAKNLLISAGYKSGEEGDRHIKLWASEGIEIELHQKFAYSDNEKQNTYLDNLLINAISKREYAIIGNYSVLVLPKLENGIVLLSHINQHLSGGLGLRQIIDWFYYVKTNLNDAYWEESFSPIADKIGMKTLAEVTTLLCKKYLGLENITWCDNADEGLADELLLYIFTKGNFGKKNEPSSNQTVSIMHKFKNPISAFQYLTDGGMSHWKLAQKHKILKPVAWIYQIFYLLICGLKRKTSLAAFAKEYKQSRTEAELLGKLQVTRK